MYIDIKVSIWQRIQLMPEGEISKEQVIDMLKREDTNSLYSIAGMQIEWDSLLGTEEQLTPADNDGMPTIELYDDDGTILWNNAPLDPFLSKVDWNALREQKLELMKLMDSLNEGSHEKLNGIIHLIDSMQDYAVDCKNLPEPMIFGKKSNDKN